MCFNPCSWISGPLGLYLHVSDKKCSHPEPNPVLSRAYDKCKNPGEETVRPAISLLILLTILLCCAAANSCTRSWLDTLQSAQVVLENSAIQQTITTHQVQREQVNKRILIFVI